MICYVSFLYRSLEGNLSISHCSLKINQPITISWKKITTCLIVRDNNRKLDEKNNQWQTIWSSQFLRFFFFHRISATFLVIFSEELFARYKELNGGYEQWMKNHFLLVVPIFFMNIHLYKIVWFEETLEKGVEKKYIQGHHLKALY